MMATASPEAEAEASLAGQHLTFTLGGNCFALDIRGVREILQYSPMTSVPLMPPFVRGVLNLRGAVVPVIDLQARLGHPPATIGRKSCIVIFDAKRDGERIVLGLLVDAVSAVLEFSGDMIEPAPAFGTSVRRDFVHAIAKVDGRFVVVLDPDRALSFDDLARAVAPAMAA